MTTYYVRKTGSDGAAGTSAGAAWATIGKALGASGIASGDTLYIGPGVYREAVTIAMTSAVAETLIIGDVDGSHTGDAPGEIQWTAFTTNDTTAASGSAPLILNGRDFLTFRNILFVGANSGTTGCVDATTTTSTDIKFTDCSFLVGIGAGTNMVNVTVAAGVAANWTIDRCKFMGNGRNSAGGTIQITLNRHSADYSITTTIRNCLMVCSGGTAFVRVQSTGAGAGFGGGVTVDSCSMIGGLSGVVTADANLSTTFPVNVVNSFIFLGSTALSANTSGQITESYNNLVAGTTRTNVTAGTGSQTAYAPLFHFGQELQVGSNLRHFGMPTSTSPLLGFGVGSSPPAVDGLNRPKPAGGSSTSIASGALERHDTAAKETSITDAGSIGLKLTGPADHDLRVPVNAAATTFTIRARYDSTHAATNKPQVQLQANGEIGVSAQTVTMTAAVDTWETLTVGPFTPTAKGVVTLRLISRSAGGSGIAYFDTLTVT